MGMDGYVSGSLIEAVIRPFLKFTKLLIEFRSMYDFNIEVVFQICTVFMIEKRLIVV